jgi:hypothetical protein
VPMPRVTSGTVPSASVFNTLAQEVDDLGVACCVTLTGASFSIPAWTDAVVHWQATTFDTRGDMWDPAYPSYVRIRVPGTYTITLQERWGVEGGSVGQRAGKIMLNGTSVFANSIASDKKAASADGEGTTVSMTAIARLTVGDLLYANYWHSSSGPIRGLHRDFGGTYMAVSRMSPIAI